MDVQLTTIEIGMANSLVEKVKTALQSAIAGEGKLPTDILSMGGMSGRKYRLFINTLVGSLDDARYLEIGSWAGSTLCSAVHGNVVRALAIDNWTQFGGPYSEFYRNLAQYKTKHAKVSFLEEDFRSVNFDAIGKFNIYLFDGPHALEDQCDGIVIAQPALEDQFVLVVDDWNWQRVRNGTMKAIRDSHLTLDFVVEIRSSLDETQPPVNRHLSDWHNGYFIAVVSKVDP